MLLIAFKAVSKHTTVQRIDLIGVNRLSFANEVLPGRPSQAARTGVAWEQAPAKKESGERSEQGGALETVDFVYDAPFRAVGD